MKNQQKTQTQSTHNTPLVFFPPPMLFSYPKSFFTAEEPTAFSLPKKHAACERAMQGQSRGWARGCFSKWFLSLSDSFAALPSKLFDASAVAESGSFGKMMQVSIPSLLDKLKMGKWYHGKLHRRMPSHFPCPGHQPLCFPSHLHWDSLTAVRLQATTMLSVKSKTAKETLSVGLGRHRFHLESWPQK